MSDIIKNPDINAQNGSISIDLILNPDLINVTDIKIENGPSSIGLVLKSEILNFTDINIEEGPNSTVLTNTSDLINITDLYEEDDSNSTALSSTEEYFNFQEDAQFSTYESVLRNLSSSFETPEPVPSLEGTYSTQSLTSFLQSVNSTAFPSERPEHAWVDPSYTFNLTNYSISTESLHRYEDDYVNGSDFFERTFFQETSSSNFTLTSWSENSSIDPNDSLSSGVGTFNFDLTTWLTLIPQNFPEDRAAGSGDVDDALSFVIFKVVVLAFISLVGSLGNIMVIWSVVKESHLHRPPFYFLLSLGVTDLSRAVFCLPVVITTVLNGSKWRHGESACKLFAFATSFFVFSSALSLLAIAIDRHVSIVYSKTYRRRSLGIANLIAAIVIWIIAFSVSFPPVVGVGDYVFIPEEAQCSYQHKNYKYNDSVSSVLVFVAILFLTYFLYFRIFRFLRAHRRMRPLHHTPALSTNWAFVGPGANGQAFINWLNGFGGQVPARQGGQRTVQRLNFGRVVNLSTAKNEHLTRLFLILTLVFGITWCPYVILSMWRIFFDDSLIPSIYVTVSAWLGYGQLAMCPVIYLMIRGPSRKPSRTMYAQAENREFLLENKTGK